LYFVNTFEIIINNLIKVYYLLKLRLENEI
jgi:hypothetical protein